VERQQFTFYRSFWEAVKLLPSTEDRLAALSAICAYALDEELTPLDGVPAAVFALIRPTLDSSRSKAQGRIKAGTSEEDVANKTGRCEEDAVNKSIRCEEDVVNKTVRCCEQIGKEKEKEKEKESYIPPNPQGEADFERFWQAYPKKVGKKSARKAFVRAKMPVGPLVTAIERQKCSDQWSRDNGQYIPNPATWLNQGRWEDELSLTEEDKRYGDVH